MKKLVVLVAVLCGVVWAQNVVVNEENFPDENFRNWILEQSWGSDGVITNEEIAGITSIIVGSKNISNLKGIEYFTALTRLWVPGNQLSEIDVSKNIALEELLVHGNQLTKLDVSNNTALTWLDAYNNQLTKIDVSNNTALLELYVDYNQLTELDLSELDNLLGFLGCSQAPSLALSGIDDNYSVAIELNSPTDLIYGITYENGILRSNSNTIASSYFSVATGNSDHRLSGDMSFIYVCTHEWDWITTITPTYAGEGEETEICGYCGAEGEVRSIASLLYTINLPDTILIFDNREKRFTTLEFVGTSTATLIENEHFTTTYINNINAGVRTARVMITGIDEYWFIATTINFTINPKPLCIDAIMPIPVQQRTGNRIEPEIIVMDGELLLIKGVDYTVSYEDNIELLGRAIVTGRNNYMGTTNRQFRITEQGAPVVNVIWGEKRVFEYNRQIQHPEWTIIHNGADIGKSGFRILNAHSEAGNYTDENGLAPFIFCLTENYKISDGSRSVDYTILPRPLTARLRNTSRERITTPEGLTKEQLDSILTIEIDFENFAEDSDGKDDKSTLGRLTFDIKKQDGNSQRSLRSQDTLDFGNYFVERISPTSTNYIVRQEIGIIIGERFLILEERPRATSISDVKKSENRHGIRFVVNPVSDNAKISVILPNNECVASANVMIYDMTGNVVWASTGSATGLSWDLRNSAGRFVANGAYLVVVEVKGANGKMYQYSARLGVKR